MSVQIQHTTYAGKHAKDYINAALLSARTLAMGGCRVRPNVKNTAVLTNVSRTGNILQPTNCDFTPVGSANTDEVILNTVRLQTQDQFCKDDLRADWESMYQMAGANDNFPAEFLQYIIYYYAGLISEAMGQIIWQGNSTLDASTNQLGHFDGFNRIIDQAPATLGAAGAAPRQSRILPAAQRIETALTGAESGALNTGEFVINNDQFVKAELRKIKAALARHTKLYSQGPGNLMLYLDTQATDAYVSSLATGEGINNQQNLWWQGGFNGLRFDGLPIFVVPEQAAGTAIVTYKNNLVFGTDLESDLNMFEVKDMHDTLLDRNVRVAAAYAAGVQVGNLPDIIYYNRPADA